MNEKALTKREQKLLTILPAALVLVIYSFLVALPKQRSYQDSLKQLENTRKTAVDKETALQSEMNLKLARDSLNRLKSRLAVDRLSIKTRSQDWRNFDSRLETVEELTEMMGRYNLSIVSQDYQDEPTVSQYLLNLFQDIDKSSPAALPIEYWQIELEGGYNELQAFLEAIDKDRMKTFPITVNMASSEFNDGIHTWTIIFVV